MNPHPFLRLLVSLVWFLVLLPAAEASDIQHSASAINPVPAATELPVYADALSSDWQDWSWGVTSNLANSSPVHAGKASIAVTYTEGWSGLLLGYHGATLDLSGYDSFRFWIHGGAAGGQPITVFLCRSAIQSDCIEHSVTPLANTWTAVDISLESLPSKQLYSLQWFNHSATGQPVFYLDDLRLEGLSKSPLALSVDVAADQHPISPYIYGINLVNEAIASDLRLPVRRWGGNATSRYHWQLDVHNAGSDWYFENIPDEPGMVDRFVEQDRRTGTNTLLTMPLMGWTPKDRVAEHPYDCGFQVSRYGAQDDVDPWDTDCGNGKQNGQPIVGNDPQDTSEAIDTAFVTDWIEHLKARYGTAATGGVLFYSLDNEPMLWNDTHRDVHPDPTTYDELRDRAWSYAAAIKSADPTAQTLGPVVFGWTAYFWSALDWASGGNWWAHPRDRLAHGDVPFVAWYLQQMKAYQEMHGTRLLDYLDLHYYPQAEGVTLSPAGDASVQARRLRSTRSLWDPAYTDESWINEPVDLIPRMRQWVTDHYPGTRLAISEYNWGALDHLNGALAQADVLGIFGREGLDLATLWGAPETVTAPGILAFRLYRNYDGQGSTFGQISVASRSNDQERLAIHAALRGSDGALTLLAINKTGENITSPVSLSGFQPAAVAQVYRYSAANLSAIITAAQSGSH